MRLPRSRGSSPNYYSDDDFDIFPPPTGKRLAPVGAASNDDEMDSCQPGSSGKSAMSNRAASALSNGDEACFDGALGTLRGSSESNSQMLHEKLRQMEEDQEELNTNLMSLTSHFAKVIAKLA